MESKVNATALLEEAVGTSMRLAKGYDTLKNLDKIDVAISAKDQVWKDGKVSLYHYSRESKASIETPVLVIYALVNRQDMMDLQPDRSYIRNLLNLGADIYIADWGYPTRADKYVTMDDYITQYIDDMVEFIKKDKGVEKVNLMGVCQGGTFCTIYSALNPDKVKNLITMVTPIDFNTTDGLLFRWSRDMDIDKVVDYYGTVPGQFLNDGFALLKPMGKQAKFMNVLNIIDDYDKLMNFLRMEHWIEDSPAQAGECYRKFIKDLYQQNKLVKGELEIDGKKVSLSNITMPLLNIYAEEDNLVPPSATIPLNDHVGTSDKTLYKFKGGHIGVFVGSRSQKELAPSVATWLSERDK